MRKRPRNKYGNIKVNGFDSRFESTVAEKLTKELAPDEMLLKQVPIKFACGAKLIIDFAIARGGQIVRYVEAKGLSTPVYKLKLRMLKHERPAVFAALEVIKSERALKYEAAIKAKAKATRDAKKAKAA